MGAVRVVDRLQDLSGVSGVTQLLSGLKAARPTAGTSGRLYFTTDTGELFIDSGSAWSYIEGARSTACIVSRNSGDGVSNLQTIGSSFVTIVLPTVGSDPGGNYNSTTNIYTCPVSGVYEVVTKLRLVDATTSGISYGQGAGTANSDGAHFQWFTTGTASRQGSLNIRKAQFSAGDQIRMYAYAQSNVGLTAAEMSITLVSA